jgi:hypothetical protein
MGPIFLVAPLDFQIVIMDGNAVEGGKAKDIEEYENYIALAAKAAA